MIAEIGVPVEGQPQDVRPAVLDLQHERSDIERSERHRRVEEGVLEALPFAGQDESARRGLGGRRNAVPHRSALGAPVVLGEDCGVVVLRILCTTGTRDTEHVRVGLLVPLRSVVCAPGHRYSRLLEQFVAAIGDCAVVNDSEHSLGDERRRGCLVRDRVGLVVHHDELDLAPIDSALGVLLIDARFGRTDHARTRRRTRSREFGDESERDRVSSDAGGTGPGVTAHDKRSDDQRARHRRQHHPPCSSRGSTPLAALVQEIRHAYVKVSSLAFSTMILRWSSSENDETFPKKSRGCDRPSACGQSEPKRIRSTGR